MPFPAMPAPAASRLWRKCRCRPAELVPYPVVGPVRLADHRADARVSLQHRLHRLERLGHRRRGLIAARHPHPLEEIPVVHPARSGVATSSQSCWSADQSSPRAFGLPGGNVPAADLVKILQAAHELRVPPVGVRTRQGAGTRRAQVDEGPGPNAAPVRPQVPPVFRGEFRGQHAKAQASRDFRVPVGRHAAGPRSRPRPGRRARLPGTSDQPSPAGRRGPPTGYRGNRFQGRTRRSRSPRRTGRSGHRLPAFPQGRRACCCPSVSPVTTATRPNPCARISLLHSTAWSGRVT